jgi:hypothetical protein
MKTSHFRTPRNFADTEFEIGHPVIERYQRQAEVGFWIYIVVLSLTATAIFIWANK